MVLVKSKKNIVIPIKVYTSIVIDTEEVHTYLLYPTKILLMARFSKKIKGFYSKWLNTGWKEEKCYLQWKIGCGEPYLIDREFCEENQSKRGRLTVKIHLLADFLQFSHTCIHIL